ncbi:MAG: pitrilysin family protein [Pseudomonadota bacterium]
MSGITLTRLCALLTAVLLAGCNATYDFSLDLGQNGGEDADEGKARSLTLLESSDRPLEVPAVRLPEYRQVTLDNGLQLVLMERHDVPLIGFDVVIRGGSIADPDGAAGTGSLLAEWLQKGAGKRNAQQFAAAVEGVGGAFSAGGSLESLRVSGEFVARDSALMIELLSDTLMRPVLDTQEFEKLRTRRVELLRAARDSDPRALIGTYGSAWLFKDHPYGRAVDGSEASLGQVSPESARRYFLDHVGADRTIVAVAGDFDSEAMEKALTAALGGWRRAAAPAPTVAAAAPVTGRRVLLVDKPGATQTYFWIGNVGVARDFDERAALNLANTVFGGRFTSMLNTELRIKSGLSYGARSRLSRPTQPGSAAIVSFTRTDATGEAIDLALATLERFRSDGLDDETLRSAKTYTLGQFPLGFETSRQLAGQMASLRFYGLDDDYVNDYPGELVAADQAGVRRTISAVYPSLDNLVFVLIGDAEALGDTPSRYGPVTRVSINAADYLPES